MCNKKQEQDKKPLLKGDKEGVITHFSNNMYSLTGGKAGEPPGKPSTRVIEWVLSRATLHQPSFKEGEQKLYFSVGVTGEKNRAFLAIVNPHM